jgi:hypothetical protein
VRPRQQIIQQGCLRFASTRVQIAGTQPTLSAAVAA